MVPKEYVSMFSLMAVMFWMGRVLVSLRLLKMTLQTCGRRELMLRLHQVVVECMSPWIATR